MTENRDVSGFSEVSLRGSGTVRIQVTGTESLTVEAEDNLLEHLTTEVVGGRLELGSSRSISPTEEIIYTVTAATLEAVTISGSGGTEVLAVNGARLSTDITGSGSIVVHDLEVGVVTVDISGSGGIELSGMADRLEVSISGSGAFDGTDLVTAEGGVSVSGSGNAKVNVSDRLDAEISGSGSIIYLGDPEISAITRGSGRIEKG